MPTTPVMTAEPTLVIVNDFLVTVPVDTTPKSRWSVESAQTCWEIAVQVTVGQPGWPVWMTAETGPGCVVVNLTMKVTLCPGARL